MTKPRTSTPYQYNCYVVTRINDKKQVRLKATGLRSAEATGARWLGVSKGSVIAYLDEEPEVVEEEVTA